jgi:hypothetical protein
MQMTTAMAQVWVSYLLASLAASPSVASLNANLKHAKEQIDLLVQFALLDEDEENATWDQVMDLNRTRKAELIKAWEMQRTSPLPEPWATRVRDFSKQEQPMTCNHKHKQKGTGVFFQSMGVIQCADCKNWQVIRSPVL